MTNSPHTEKTEAAGAGMTALGSIFCAAVASACTLMAGAAAGVFHAGGPAAAKAGAVAMGSVGLLFFAGSAAGLHLLGKRGIGSRAGAAVAAFAVAASVGVAGFSGFEIGKALQTARNGNLEITVGTDAKSAFEKGIDPDRRRQILDGIRRDSIEKLRRENAGNYQLCVSNRDAFAARGIPDCAVYNPAVAP